MGCFGSKQATTNTKASNISGKSSAEGKVEDIYTIGEEIGRGAFSVVKQGINKKTGVKYAIKYIEKRHVVEKHIEQLKREIEIMKKVDNPNILRLVEIYETDEILTLVLELVTGGELFYKIVDRGCYSEYDAANIVRQIVAGVNYLHQLGIAHRDLKPENLLCSGEDEENQGQQPFRVVIADFGLSKVFGGGERLETSCGTPDYVAPEVLTCDNGYDNSVDMWSVGVITYIILCGFPPFFAKTQNALFEKILEAKVNFPSPEWDKVSDNAKAFIKGLIVKEPSQRLTAAQASEHPWLQQATLLSKESNLDVRQPMQEYNKARKTAITDTGDNSNYDRTDSGELNPLKT